MSVRICHSLNQRACALLSRSLPASRLTGKEGTMWLLDRRAGKQGERTLRDYFQNPPRRVQGPYFCSLSCKDHPTPYSHPHFSFRYPTPCLAPSPRTSPSVLHAATTTKAGTEKPEDVPCLSSEKMAWTQGKTGQEACGRRAEKWDSRRRHLGWRQQCISH